MSKTDIVFTVIMIIVVTVIVYTYTHPKGDYPVFDTIQNAR